MMFQQRQSEAKTQLLREDNEIEMTGKARETTSLCATRIKGEGRCENGCLLGTMYMNNTWGEENRRASLGRGIRKPELVDKKRGDRKTMRVGELTG